MLNWLRDKGIMATDDKLVIEGLVPGVVAPNDASGIADSRSASTVKETPFEALSSICSVLVAGVFILTFLAQNVVIPSGSMEKTLLVGDHLLVDRITFAPSASWMPLVHYREPRRGDIVVFFKPGNPDMYLVKRLVAIPGDHVHLRNGAVILNGVPQTEPKAAPWPGDGYQPYIDNFPEVSPSEGGQVTEEWVVDLPTHIQGDDLVVPPGMFFMMGDHRHASLDSRFWGFVPRANIVGRPLFNYWSFKTPDDQMYRTGLADRIAWMGNVVLHFFTDTRWKRTLNPVS
jgi:signal peptidase I